MRRFSLFLLLATASAQAIAAAPGDDDRGNRRNRGGESTQQSDSQSQRNVENRRSQGGEQRVRTERVERSQSEQSRGERVRELVREHREQQAQAVTTQSNDEGNRSWRRGNHDASNGAGDDNVRIRRRDENSNVGSSNWRPRERQVRTIPDTQPNVVTQGRRGDIARAYDGRPRRDYRNGNYNRWSSNRWRYDNRYDWRRYRDRNRSHFRLGFYYDPFGWSYRRWSLGSFLFPSYYSSRYWLNDPWQYRLPPAYGPYRWVRYWDDALLVNIYTGEVEDVIYNFFW